MFWSVVVAGGTSLADLDVIDELMLAAWFLGAALSVPTSCHLSTARWFRMTVTARAPYAAVGGPIPVPSPPPTQRSSQQRDQEGGARDPAGSLPRRGRSPSLR